MMGYLLGFPTPVVEVFMGLVLLFVVLSVYFGTRFEGTASIREEVPGASGNPDDRIEEMSGKEVTK